MAKAPTKKPAPKKSTTPPAPKVTQTDLVGKQQTAQFTPAVAPTAVDPTTVAPAQQAAQVQLAPAAQLDQTNANQFRAAQSGLVDQLQQQALGQGPSIANAQFQQAANQNIAQQQALAASQRGAAAGLAGRQAMINAAGINQNLAGQSAINRLQEQLDARKQLGDITNQARGLDVNAASTNAGLAQQTNLAQGTLAQGTNLANAGYGNTLIGQQAGITAQQAAQNASQNQQTNLFNAYGTGQTSEFNAGQGNQLNLGQAQIKGREAETATQAAAQLGSAKTYANASVTNANTAAQTNALIAAMNNQTQQDIYGTPQPVNQPQLPNPNQ